MSIGSTWRAERWSIISFAAGTILFALGITLIVESRYTDYTDWEWIADNDPEVDAGYWDIAWNEGELATGIALALVGTSACTASLTYAILRRKRKSKEFSSCHHSPIESREKGPLGGTGMY